MIGSIRFLSVLYTLYFIILTKISATVHSDSFLIAQYLHYLKYDHSNCPKETWLIDMHAVDPGKDKLFIDIGFNKGYNFAIWMSLWTPELNINTKKWMKLLTDHMPNIPVSELCGYCQDCHSNMFTREESIIDTSISISTRSLTMIGFDINPTNIALVNNVTSDKSINNANSKYFDPSIPSIFTYTAAISGNTGTLNVWDCEGSVIENCKISRSPRRGHSLQAVTMDDYLDSIMTAPSVHLEGPFSIPRKNDANTVNTINNISYANVNKEISDKFDYKLHKSRIIDMLIIDTEGHDAEVLFGSMKYIEKHKIRCIIFEYHQYCPWPKTPLFQVIRKLHDAGKFVCYFEGQGRLFQLTGQYHPLFEFNEWSNVICIQKYDIWHPILERYRVTPQEAFDALTNANMLNHTFTVNKGDSNCG